VRTEAESPIKEPLQRSGEASTALCMRTQSEPRSSAVKARHEEPQSIRSQRVRGFGAPECLRREESPGRSDG
jgi:hypothetical protein